MAVYSRLSMILGAAWYSGAEASAAVPRQLSLAQRAAGPEFAKHHGNPCDDEDDGWQCDDGAAVQCVGGVTASLTYCKFFEDCEENGDTASCVEDTCKDKADGLYCEDDHVVECKGLVTVNTTTCAFYQECKRNATNPLDARCQEEMCARKRDGQYCEDGHVVECMNRITVNTTSCGLHSKCHDEEWPTPTATCYDDCFQKSDGGYRKEAGVLRCLGGQTQSYTVCPFYQVSSEGEGTTASCQEDACDSKGDGWHCKGQHLVQCSDFVTVDIAACGHFQSCKESAESAGATCV